MEMRRISIKFLFIFLLASTMFSCEDNRMNDIAEDKIYLIKSGLQDAQIFNFGTYQYELAVCKSGIGSQEANLKLSINSELLASYNAENNSQYEILPENCFTLETNELNISDKEASGKFSILFNTTEITKLSSQGKSFALPLSVVSVNKIEVLPENADVVLIPVLSEPYIAFAEPGLSASPLAISLNDPESFNVPVTIQTNYKSKTKLDFKIEVDTQELAKYNEANNANYLLLPENAYELFPGEYSLSAGQKSKDLNVSIIRKNLLNKPDLYLFGEYILPLRITEVSENSIDPQAETLLLHISCSAYKLSRSIWEVIDWNSCICEEAKYVDLNRTPDKLLDDDVATFWGSKWDSPKPMPYYFLIDMKDTKNVTKIGLRKPDNIYRGNQKKGYFEISNDLNTWTKIGDWEITSNGTRSHVFEVTPSQGRYLRFVLTEAFTYVNNTIGPNSGAQMDLSELYVWGVD
ncbi:BT_3987 domain-containing protein [Maribellus luteus]|nr:DUF1735 domain-containing protein [Maribellus luteus]